MIHDNIIETLKITRTKKPLFFIHFEVLRKDANLHRICIRDSEKDMSRIYTGDTLYKFNKNLIDYRKEKTQSNYSFTG